MLARTVEVLAQLHVSKCRQDRVSRRGGGSPSTPLVYRVDASESMARIREVLQGIGIAWAKDHKATAIYVSSPVELARFIGARLSWVTKHQMAPFWEEALASAVREAWKVVDVPDDLVRMGVCGADLDDGPCMVELWHDADQSRVECPRCGTVWSVAERQQADIQSAAEVELPLSQAVTALAEYGMSVTYRQARRWTQTINPETGQPWLVPTREDGKGVRLYRMRDVAAVADDPPKRGRPPARSA